MPPKRACPSFSVPQINKFILLIYGESRRDRGSVNWSVGKLEILYFQSFQCSKREGEREVTFSLREAPQS